MTDKYAVIGNPIAHSKSPEIHTMFADQFKGTPAGDIVYKDRILVPPKGFTEAVERLRKEGYKGCNVTVPFKSEAFQLATEFTPRAKVAQAVNTLKFDGDTIIGDNTDGTGLTFDIRFNLHIKLSKQRVLLLGAGGAANGVALPLVQVGANITIVNRTADKAEKLATRIPFIRPNAQHDNASKNYTGKSQWCSYDDLVGQFNVVINATSTGLSDEMPPLPPGIFAPGALAYDMMYGRETRFMKFAREHGAAIVSDGLGMLVEQAAESFYIWRNVRPETAPVIAVLRQQQ